MVPPTILFDLDGTLHEDEGRHKIPAWNHILRPWGYAWAILGDVSPNLHVVSQEQKPKRGLHPSQFISHFVEGLHLDLASLSRENLSLTRFSKRTIDELVSLQNSSLAAEQQKSALIRLLEREWGSFLLKSVQEKGVIRIPGAQDMIRSFHTAGYKIGIVTQAPLPYAQAVVDALWLRDEVDCIVSGYMVSDPKPHPEALVRAQWLLRWSQRVKEETGDKKQLAQSIWEECLTTDKPVAVVGDSASDIASGKAYGIPTVILAPKERERTELRSLEPTLMVTSLHQITPPLLQREPFIGFFRQETEGVLSIPFFRQKERR